MRDGKRNARLREELVLAGLKGGTGCVSRAVCRFGTDADAACIALAFAAVVSAVLYIANDAANELRAVALTICFLLLFVQFVFLFSADFCLQGYFARQNQFYTKVRKLCHFIR